MQVLYETKMSNPVPVTLSRQVCHIPTWIMGVRNGSYTRQIKSVSVKGTVRVKDAWGAEHAASYGVCRHANQEIALIHREDEGYWQGIYARPCQGK